MLFSSSARTWAITSVIAGLLVGVGFSVPWFFASGVLVGPGWQGLETFIQDFQQGYPVPLDVLLLALFLFLLFAALLFLAIGALGLTGRTAPWMVLMQIVVVWIGVIPLVLGVGLTEFAFYTLTDFELSPNAALIPGIGVLLMVAGLLTALVSGIRFDRSGRQQAGGAAPAS